MKQSHGNHPHKLNLNVKCAQKDCNYHFYDMTVIEGMNHFAAFKLQQVHSPPVFANSQLIWQWMEKSTQLEI